MAYTEDEERAIMGAAPSLFAVNDAFGQSTAQSWLRAQLIELAEFAGASGKLSDQQLVLLARQMYADHKHWPVTVFMLFFARLKSGCYGKFFGNVDPMMIAESFHKFEEYKQDQECFYYNQRKAALKAAEEAEHAAKVRRHREHLARLGITQQQWLDNMDIFMDGRRERCLPEDEERRMLRERGVI